MKRFLGLSTLAFVAILGLIIFSSPTVFAQDEGFTSNDQSGNDPREFSSKFMPYYRYTELENDLEVNEFTMFGFFAFNPRFGMTYEWPIAKEVDYSDVDEFKAFKAGTGGGNLPPIGEQPGGGGDIPFDDLDDDGDVVGIGDLGLRFFLRPRQWEWDYMEGTKNFSLMPLVEFTLPTANEDVLGGESFIVSPGFVAVFDLPFKKPPLGLAFFAMMNFYDFDAWKDSSRDDTSRYRGRWFYMQPLSKPAFVKDPEDKGFHFFDLSGLYAMTEFQPVYDFEESQFNFWIGPEIGKIVREGTIFYAKPGWGIANGDDSERNFTFEVGFRYFMN